MIHTQSYDAPPVNTAELLRYAGVRDSAPELAPVLQACLAEAEAVLTYQVCWQELPLRISGQEVKIGPMRAFSADLARHLAGCESVILFAATVGLGLDRLITRYSRVSPVKALFFQAIGAERIESLCEVFCLDIHSNKAISGNSVTPRFSPGYGDLPLTLQREIFALLDCPRKIGLTLNDSLLMSPTKSVTALLGVKAGTDCNAPHRTSCSACPHKTCAYRRLT